MTTSHQPHSSATLATNAKQRLPGRITVTRSTTITLTTEEGLRFKVQFSPSQTPGYRRVMVTDHDGNVAGSEEQHASKLVNAMNAAYLVTRWTGYEILPGQLVYKNLPLPGFTGEEAEQEQEDPAEHDAYYAEQYATAVKERQERKENPTHG